MKSLHSSCWISALWLAAISLGIQTLNGAEPGRQQNKIFESETKSVRLAYLLHFPAGYESEPQKKWPLLIFLHGAGERGSDLNKVKVHGPPKIADKDPAFPFILASPQCPEGKNWDTQPVMELLEHLTKSTRVDTTRIYLTGLSMGGYGSWTLASRHPDRFAAVVPICGGGSSIDPKIAGGKHLEALKTLPIWAFHGARDTVVVPGESERMVEEFKKRGCQDIKLTIYPEAGHDSWTATYSNPQLYEWLLGKRRP